MNWFREQRRREALVRKQDQRRCDEMRDVIRHNWPMRHNPFCRDLIRYAVGYIRG